MHTQNETAQPSKSASTPQKKLNEIKISYFKDATSTEPRDVPINQVIRAIRDGGSKTRPLVAEIREARQRGDKAKAGELKKQLPAVTVSGTFHKRNNNSLIQHSGLVCTDLDSLNGELENVRTALRQSRHLVALWVSSSGVGLKALFRVPADPAKHAGSFRALEQHVRELTGKQVDQACKDVARLCFMSYDPDIYINENAVEIEPLPEPEHPRPPRGVENFSPDLPLRERIASENLGPLTWSAEKRGLFCRCPGEASHTNGTGETHTIVYLETVPTIKCQHSSCARIVEAFNHTLRSRISKAEREASTQPQTRATDNARQAADDEAIKRLATMSPIEYDRVRRDEAEKLGCQLATLDKLVQAKRPKTSADGESLQGDAVVCPDHEPWPEPVNGADVLSGISASVTAYCAVPDGAADVVALFCAHTHCFELFRISPRLHITSPTLGCGKSTLRDVVALFVKKPLSAESLSTAVGFRVVAEEKPTLLADEIDRWLVNNDELCGFFNSNYKRGAVFLRCEGEDNKVRKFKAYSPAVICGIGALRGRLATLHDRSIVIRLERAKPGELSLPFNEENTEKEHELTRKLARWIADNGTQIAQCKPALPEGVHNRLADNWRPLFAIAEVLGDEWRQRIFEAFAALHAQKLDIEALGIQLLRDIHDTFKEKTDDVTDGWISSLDLIAHLKGKTESPWDEANKGKPINPRWLSVRLAEYDIKPDKLPGGHERGYQVASFQNAFDRYVLCVQVSRQPVLRGKTTWTDSWTDRKTQVSSQVSSAPTRENDPCLTDGHIGEPEKALSEEQAENARIDAMSDAEFNAWWNTTKAVEAGDWIKLFPDETQPHWQAAYKQVIESPCPTCGASMRKDEYLWANIETRAAHCLVCRETEWRTDGYDIDEFGNPWCWSHRHTREERIAERTRDQIEKAAHYRAQRRAELEGLNEEAEYVERLAIYEALLAQEKPEVRQWIEQLCEKERSARGARVEVGSA